jgi:glutathione S-transferase
MITLWHCVDARSFRALWALEEVGQPYRLEILPFPPRYLAREYLAINPLGTVPLMIDRDVRMTESAAICQYLAERYAGPPLAVRPDEPGYGAYLNGLHFGEATLTFPQSLVLRYSVLEPQERRSAQVAADYSRWFLSRLRGVDAVVSRQPTLCAGRFTVADISVGFALRLSEFIGLDGKFSPAVAAYWKSLKERDGFRRAIARQETAGRDQGVARLQKEASPVASR